MNSELKPRLLKLGYLSKIQRQSGKNKKQNSGCSGVFLFLIKETLMKMYLLFFGYKRFNSFDEREGLTPRIVLRKDVTFSMEKKRYRQDFLWSSMESDFLLLITKLSRETFLFLIHFHLGHQVHFLSYPMSCPFQLGQK